MSALPDVVVALARHGLALGTAGYSLVSLEALAKAQGWQCTVEGTERPAAWARYRAQVWRPADPRDPAARTWTARSRAPSAEEALATALAKALERWPGESDRAS